MWLGHAQTHTHNKLASTLFWRGGCVENSSNQTNGETHDASGSALINGSPMFFSNTNLGTSCLSQFWDRFSRGRCGGRVAAAEAGPGLPQPRTAGGPQAPAPDAEALADGMRGPGNAKCKLQAMKCEEHAATCTPFRSSRRSVRACMQSCEV